MVDLGPYSLRWLVFMTSDVDERLSILDGYLGEYLLLLSIAPLEFGRMHSMTGALLLLTFSSIERIDPPTLVHSQCPQLAGNTFM